MLKIKDSVIHSKGVQVEELKYVENGVEYASGEGVLATVEDYLERLGYDLDEIDNYEWRDVVGNDEYEVSELGLIRNKETGEFIDFNLKDKYEEGNKAVWRMKTWIKGLRVKRPFVSEIVAEAFLGARPEEKSIIGHKNDIPLDNRVDNLEYITPSENHVIWRVVEQVRRGEITEDYVEELRHAVRRVVCYREDSYSIPDSIMRHIRWYVEDDVTLSMVKAVHDLEYHQDGVLSRLTVVDGKYKEDFV